MWIERFSRTAMFVLVVVFVLSAGEGIARDGRDIVGNYALTSASEQGDQVELTLTLRLMNYSGADITKAAVTLRHSQPSSEQLGMFAPIENWPSGRDIVVQTELTIPRDEFQRWRSVQPSVFVVDTDDHGMERQRWVQLSQRPLIHESRGADR